jgi:hypothetical protein
MAETRKKELDFDLFRKCVRHFDNPNMNERDAFILQGLKLCADSGVLFWDAVRQAFGGGNDEELRARNTALEAENAKLRAGVQALNEELAAATEGAESRRRRQGRGFAGLLGEAWSMAQFRLVLLTGLIALQQWLFLHGQHMPLWGNLLGAALVVLAFVKWSGRQYEQSGLGAAVMKLTIFGGGLWLACGDLIAQSLGVTWLPQPDTASGGFTLLLVMLLLGLSGIAERLAGLTARSDLFVFKALRWWFRFA